MIYGVRRRIVENCQTATSQDRAIYDELNRLGYFIQPQYASPATNTNGGKWSQVEIEAFISALHSFDENIEMKNIFKHISNQLETRNPGQRYEFFHSVRRKVEESQ